MKTLISLTILLVAAVSHADPTLLKIARNANHAEHASLPRQQQAKQFLNELYSKKVDPDGAEDRQDLLTWLAKSPHAQTLELSPLLVQILSVEQHEQVRKETVMALGNLGSGKAVETALIENLFPPAGFRFRKYTSVREESARSLGLLQRRFPNAETLPITLATLDRAAKDKSLLAGAIDGIALCNVELPEVRELLSKILSHQGTEYTELQQIRVVQWFRHYQSALPEMVEELRAYVQKGKHNSVKECAAYNLLLAKKADAATMESLTVLAKTSDYAKRLLDQSRKSGDYTAPILTAGPSIADLCHFVNSRAN